MPAWLGITIFSAVFGLIIYGIIYAVKETKARKKVANNLGLIYQESNTELVKKLDKRFTVFSKGKTELGSVIKGKKGPVEYFLAKYTYVEDHGIGKKDRETFGTVICFHHTAGNLKQLDDTNVLSMPDWNIEQDQKWAVIYPDEEVFKLSGKARSHMLTAKNMPALNEIARNVASSIA